MIKKTLVIAGLCLIASPALAQSMSAPSVDAVVPQQQMQQQVPTSVTGGGIKQNIQQGIHEVKTGMQNGANAVQQDVKAGVQKIGGIIRPNPMIATTSSALSTSSVSAMRVQIQQARDSAQAAIANMRATAQATIATQRAALQTKLAAIKDTQKQATVLKLNDQFAQINQNKTDQLNTALNTISEALGKIQENSAALQSAGTNTTDLDAKIAVAQTAINTARAAVVVQAGKTYPITITTATALKTSVGAVSKTLEADIGTTRSTVAAARTAVQQALTALTVLQGSPATTTTNTTPPTTSTTTNQ